MDKTLSKMEAIRNKFNEMCGYKGDSVCEMVARLICIGLATIVFDICRIFIILGNAILYAILKLSLYIDNRPVK